MTFNDGKQRSKFTPDLKFLSMQFLKYTLEAPFYFQYLSSSLAEFSPSFATSTVCYIDAGFRSVSIRQKVVQSYVGGYHFDQRIRWEIK